VRERNAETMREMLEAWAADRPGDYFDPDIEMIMPHPGMSSTGADQANAAMREFRSLWDDYRFELEDVRAIDDTRVLALFTERVRGSLSGIEQVARPGLICTFRNDKVVRFEAYLHREEALRAAGRATPGGESADPPVESGM
jgi:ketosteroid isomerase-like protein